MASKNDSITNATEKLLKSFQSIISFTGSNNSKNSDWRTQWIDFI